MNSLKEHRMTFYRSNPNQRTRIFLDTVKLYYLGISPHDNESHGRIAFGLDGWRAFLIDARHGIDPATLDYTMEFYFLQGGDHDTSIWVSGQDLKRAFVEWGLLT